ncbi:alpha-L-fucosidase [bacterium AH-315-I18]|nr:alpha-L-fucosidase [Phycisphaeraceae bacterium]MBN4060864.1 alpha-L-fucosidase [bacterium AH-315-I18]
MGNDRVKTGDIMDHSTADKLAANTDLPWMHDRMAWFQDQKFGLFIHWGIYSVWGIRESWPLSPADQWARSDTMKPWVERDRDLARFSADYRALNGQFNPVQFDPQAWAAAAEHAGMKYVCFTTKHHDGFCMFDTRTTDYRMTHPSCPFHTNPRANVTKEVFDAFRQRGMGIWCYYSKSDWHTPSYWSPDFPVVDRNPNYDTLKDPQRWDKFVQYTHEQMRELLSEYGKIDVLWLDGGQVQPPHQDIRMDEIAAFGRELQPQLIIADRTVGGKHENFITPEQTVPDEPLGCPWESCVTMGPGFSYGLDDVYKPVEELVHLLIDVVAKGGNLLLNVAPSPEGLFAPGAMEALNAIGDWMQIHGQAIYGTRAIAPYVEGNLRFTRKDDTVYVFVLKEAEQAVGEQTVVLRSLQPREGETVTMLGYDTPLQWVRHEDHVVVNLPSDVVLSDYAWAMKFQIA